MVIPYLPSTKWIINPYSERFPNRTMIAPDVVLTLPVEGGRSAVKRGNADQWLISGHGNWRHTHIQTIKTILGRTPYCGHYMPEYEKILESHADSTPFLELTAHLFQWMEKQLDLSVALPRLRAEKRKTATIADYAAEIQRQANPDVSLLTEMMKFGKDAIFLLI